MPDGSVAVVFGTSFLVGFSGAVSPGPLLAFDIRETMRRGFWAGPFVAAGHAILELVTVVGLAFGVARILDSDLWVASIGILGGVFLLWMAWGMLRNPGRGAPGTATQHQNPAYHGMRGPIVGGVLVSLSNPYWAIWWISIGAALMTRSLELGVAGVAAFYVGHVLSDFTWYTVVSAALASGRRLVTERVYKGIMLGCGAFLGAMGVYFVVAGARLLV